MDNSNNLQGFKFNKALNVNHVQLKKKTLLGVNIMITNVIMFQSTPSLVIIACKVFDSYSLISRLELDIQIGHLVTEDAHAPGPFNIN